MTRASDAGIPERVHLVGIGGVHVSGIARILAAWGHQVTGSDLRLSPLTDALASVGVSVVEGHAAPNVGDAQLVVTTSASKKDNPELVEARRRGIPVLKRAEFIARLMEGRYAVCVAGTHGKTTTTGLVASMLVKAGRSPTYLVGGEVRDLAANAAPGDGREIVVEADEFDRAFLEYQPDLAVVTNVEPDHLDIYGSFDALAEAFGRFMTQVKADGRLIVGIDSSSARELVEETRAQAMVETFALNRVADWTAEEAEALPNGSQAFAVLRNGESLGRFETRLPGKHNVSNALAGIAVGHALALPTGIIRESVAAYSGAKRRFEYVGEAAGVTVMDDYSHHPTEVAAAIAAAQERFSGRRLVAVFQPHTYSRTRYLLEGFRTCFRGLDEIVLLATYAARELETAGMDARDLVEEIEAPRARYAATFQEAAESALDLLHEGDVFFTIGAGDVDAVGPLVLEGLSRRERGAKQPADSAEAVQPSNPVIGRTGHEGGGSPPPELLRSLRAITSVRLGEPLSRHTTFGIGGPADVYVVAQTAEELSRIVLACREHDVQCVPLGSGSNILVGDGGIRGVVIDNRARALKGPEEGEGGELVFRAESGASMAGVARRLARQGFAGLEWASGIPGTLGGAVVYNAGAYGGCIADVLRSISAVNGTGATRDLPAVELDLAYRGSAFTRGQFAHHVILAAEFTVWKGNAQDLMQRVQELDVRRLTAQPRGRNAGSIFKNAPERPAWRLIDDAGLRGHRMGDAQISEKHCNFILNLGSARASDVKSLIDLTRERVRARSGAELELEITLVGEGFDD